MLKHSYILISFVLVLLMHSCTEVPEGVISNQSPETYLSLYPDSTISPQKTRIKITWWGDDPDGLVTGFRFSFDSTNWTTTTKNDSTFQLVISGNDSTFRFWVASIDDKGLIDPTPATNLYPVVNTPPSVSFNLGTEIPDTTLPLASFSWTGTDPDGDNSIKNYHWALNDTSNWHTISPNTILLTLRQTDGIDTNANNIFFLKVEDIAGSFSRTIRMPDTNKTWFVRGKRGNILLLNDYSRQAPTDASSAITFYRNALDTPSLNIYSYLDIKVSNGANLPKIINPMFIETLKLFQCVIWFGKGGGSVNENFNFDLTQQALPYFIAAGGKLFFSSGMPTSLNSQGNIINFANIDSLTTYNVPGIEEGTPTIVVDNNYPTLFSGFVIEPNHWNPQNTRGIYHRQNGSVIYRMPFNPPYDTTKIAICTKDSQNNPKVIFMTVPLNRMNFTTNNATYFLRKVLGVDFGIN